METTQIADRLQQLKSTLLCSNAPSDICNFKVKGEDANIVKDLLLFNYECKVHNRKGGQPIIEKSELDICVRWMTDQTFKPSLMLYGTPGTGKTTYMACMFDIFNTLYKYNSRYYFKYCKASELGNIMKNNPDEFKGLKGATILFIDDLGFNGECEMVNDYGVKRKPIEEILDFRYDKMRATCCTSNLNIKQILENYGEKIYSRMMEQFAFLAMTGTDYRINKTK